jgi:hypothetical protein
MKRQIVTLLLLVAALCTKGLSQNVDYIRNSGLYNFGIGMGANYAEARRNALQSLTEGISVHIKSEFINIVKETNGNVDDYSKSVVSSYSTAVINQYQERLLSEKPDRVELMLYISKDDLQKVFDERAQLIRDLIVLGEKAESELRISDALRNFYWAMILTRSHPNNRGLRHDFGSQSNLPILKGLSDKIESIFTNLRFEVNSVNQQHVTPRKQIELTISYCGKPVQNLDYTYFTGDGWSGITSIRDGKGIAIVDGPYAAQLNQLRLKVEYQYANKSHLEPEVKQIMESVVVPYFQQAEVYIGLSSKQQNVSSALASEKFSKIDANLSDYDLYVAAIGKVTNAIRTNSFMDAKGLFSPEGWGIFNKLIANGKITVLDTQTDTLRVLKINDEVMVRSVPMLFAFNNNRTKFVEKVVFTFNNENKITNLTFALGQKATDDILQKPTGFGTLEEKYFLIRFMENYKTAYSLKRTDYLEAIFDENALIIVGNIVQRAPEPTDRLQQMYGNFSNDEVEYIVLSKSEYMDRLKRVFQRNEFVNIHFEDNQVRKTQRDDKIYGIQIAQHYYSSTYADKGYLFLMIDLNDTIQPKIYVRTWQPKKNADGTVIGIENFKF